MNNDHINDHIFDTSDEMDQFHQRYKLAELSQEKHIM